MAVPLLDLKSQHAEIESELTAAFSRVLRSGCYILGPEIEQAEKAFADFLGTRHAITVSSGTDAILLALMSLGIGPGDEVLCPSFTFFATAGCVSRVGARPVFLDSCPACFNLDPEQLARHLTSRTKAIIPVHLFGQSAEMDDIMEFARDHGLHVIEDAAQALGARYRDRMCGTIGTFGTYSFFPSKNLGCLGDGGLLVTDDDALAERAILLRTHGAKPKYFHKHVGGNFRMDALQAAFLNIKLPHLQRYAENRRRNAEYYIERLQSLPGVSSSARKTGICCNRVTETHEIPPEASTVLPEEMSGRFHIWNQFTLRIPGRGRRDALRDFLRNRGIGSEIYYPIPLHRQECFAGLNTDQSCLPVADKLADESLSLPVYPELSRAQQDEVLEGITEFFAALNTP